MSAIGPPIPSEKDVHGTIGKASLRVVLSALKGKLAF